MGDLQSLEEQIQQRLKSVKEKERLQQMQLEAEIKESEKRLAQFDQLTNELMTSIIEPRMEKLVSFFNNAELLERNEAGTHSCVCQFHHTDRYPASVTLTLSVAHDQTVDNLLFEYDLDILPKYFTFKGHDQALFPMDNPNHAQVADWINKKILAFVDVYLQLEKTEQYHQNLVVTDPVCGRKLNKRNAVAESVYADRTYYFCSDRCHEEFRDNPQRYATRKSH